MSYTYGQWSLYYLEAVWGHTCTFKHKMTHIDELKGQRGVTDLTFYTTS